MRKRGLTAEVQLGAGAERVDDVDDQPVRGGAEGQRPGGHQQCHHVEEVGQVGRHVQRVVEGQHQHVARQDGDVVPHQVLLQGGRGRQAGLIDDLTHPTDHLGTEGGAGQSSGATLQPLTDEREQTFRNFRNGILDNLTEARESLTLESRSNIIRCSQRE